MFYKLFSLSFFLSLSLSLSIYLLIISILEEENLNGIISLIKEDTKIPDVDPNDDAEYERVQKEIGKYQVATEVLCTTNERVCTKM